MAELRPVNGDHRADTEQEGLTSIPHGIHCNATQDEDTENELDRITIENFLHTLAEVAFTVSMRIRESIRIDEG